MNLLLLVWSYLKSRPLTTVLNILLLALGIAVITVLLLFSNQLNERISSNAKGIDLVVGAKGSPLQLILCSVFHIDFPTGNIKLSEAERVSRHRMVKSAIPLALGDSYGGYRIVGTTRYYPELYNATLAAGSWWMKGLDVTVGALAAERLGLKIGDRFTSTHGLTTEGHGHEEHRYLVTGVMEFSNTIMDNLILTNIESIWMVHSQTSGSIRTQPLHPSTLVGSVEAGDSTKEITSLIIQYRNPLAIIQLPRYINSNSRLQAAAPAFETARLFSILGVGVDVLRGFAMVLIFISGLSIFIALYSSLRERQYDLAIMRSLGAGRKSLFLSVVMEGSGLTMMGSLAGIILGHFTLYLFTTFVEESGKAGMAATVFYTEEGYLLFGSLMLGILCSLLPAIQAYRTDIHKVLAGS